MDVPVVVHTLPCYELTVLWPTVQPFRLMCHNIHGTNLKTHNPIYIKRITYQFFC